MGEPMIIAMQARRPNIASSEPTKLLLQVLLAAGQYRLFQDNEGWSPQPSCSIGGPISKRLLDLLIAHGANPNRQLQDGVRAS